MSARRSVPSMPRRLAAEAVGTAFLLAAIVGSGIVLTGDGAGSAGLFQHAAVVGVALAALIATFGPISGAHLNPVVSVADAVFGGMSARRAGAYVAAQVTGAVVGTLVTHLTFGLPPLALATRERLGADLAGGEAMATFGLLVVIFGLVRGGNSAAIPAAVGGYVFAAIAFTSSGAFANPAVTVARMLTDTGVAIAPRAVPGFLAGQLLGAAAAVGFVGWLIRPDPIEAADVVVPQHDASPTGSHP